MFDVPKEQFEDAREPKITNSPGQHGLGRPLKRKCRARGATKVLPGSFIMMKRKDFPCESCHVCNET